MTGIDARWDHSKLGLATETRRLEEEKAPAQPAAPPPRPSTPEPERSVAGHRGSGAGTASVTHDLSAAQLANRIAQQLDKKKNGGLTGDELAAVHADARRRASSTQAADDQMRKALGQRLPELTADGAEWVQNGLGDMKGLADDYQRVLGALEPGAKLIDADWDGRLSAGDVLLKPARAGGSRGTAKLIDEATRDRVKLNAEVVNAAWDMAKAKHGFATLDEQTFHDRFWVRDPSGRQGTFKLKPGASPAEAMEDIFKNPDEYKFDCATAMVVTLYQGVKKALGREAFEALAKDLRVGQFEMEGDLARTWFREGDASRGAGSGFAARFVPGETGYIRNWDVSPEGLRQGWQGENVIALGHGKFYGHPFGVVTADQVIAYLNRHRNPGSTRSAGFANSTGELSTELV